MSRALRAKVPKDIDGSEFATSLSKPTEYYLQALQEFHQNSITILYEHRKFFTSDRRGFGEDAFHVMWLRLIREFKPKTFLEIGVYRGQVLSLASLIAREEGLSLQASGISPFAPIGDSVSSYRNDVDYQQDTLANFRQFDLPEPTLVKAYSTDPQAVEYIQSKSWDMIYIDGGHDYETVAADWSHCADALAVGGIIVLDDSGLGTAYRPFRFSTGGHPGPSRLAGEIDRERFREILQMGHNRAFQKVR